MAFYDSEKSKLYVAEFDLTSYTTGMVPSHPRTLDDVSAFGDGGRKWHPGISDAKLSWEGLFDDTATTGSDVALDALRAATAAKVCTVWPGDTVVGNVGSGSAEMWLTDQDIPARVGGIVTMTGNLEASKWDRLKSLGPKATSTASADGTSIDDSASSSDGGKWFYHILAFSATGGNARWQIVLEDSANDSSFATVGSESVNITAVGAARRAFTGTLRRYVRLRVVRDATSGSLTYIAGYERD